MENNINSVCKEHRVALGDMSNTIIFRKNCMSCKPELIVSDNKGTTLIIELGTIESYKTLKTMVDRIGDVMGVENGEPERPNDVDNKYFDLEKGDSMELVEDMSEKDYALAEHLLKGLRDSVPNAEDLYLYGKCLDLALILERFFPYGLIMYDENHFVFKLHDKYFDIRGEVTKEMYDCSNAIPLFEYPIYRIREMLRKE